MPGAAILSANGALRGGAGLVTVATAASAISSIAPATACATYIPLAESSTGSIASSNLDVLRERAQDFDALVIGPGLGQERGTVGLVRRLVAQVQKPLVLDADGLNAMAGEPQALRIRSAPTLLTPHPGEFVRLHGGEIPTTDEERRDQAEESALRFASILCLKGHATVVTDGKTTYVNDTGNPSMASGGAGDVLSGLLAALVCQFETPMEAAVCAVRVHGLAGDLAAKEEGPLSVIATDLLDFLGPAFECYAEEV